jgi:hypothetical protein
MMGSQRFRRRARMSAGQSILVQTLLSSFDHPHTPPASLFQRIPLPKLRGREREHIEQCRDCALYAQLHPAVTFADAMIDGEEPEPSTGAERAGAARLVLRWWARTCRGSLRTPRAWGHALRGLISALLLVAKTVLGRVRAWCGRFGLPASGSSDDMRDFWEAHMVAALAHGTVVGADPDDRTARAHGFRRVVLPAGVPQFALLKTQPASERRRDLAVFVPSLFVPAIAEKNLRFARRLHEQGLHVLIVDPVQAGATDWWSPLAPPTGGWQEGRDLAMAVRDLREQLGDRVQHTWLMGAGLGATIALWSLVHARSVGLDVHRVMAVAPVTHVGAAVAHLEPSRWTSYFDCWKPDFEIRAFYRLMMDERHARHRALGNELRSMRDYLRSAGVDEADLGLDAPAWHPTPVRLPIPASRNTIPGDLLSAALELRKERSRITIIASKNDLVVPWAHARRLADALDLEVQAASHPWVDGEGFADDTCGRIVVSDGSRSPEDTILDTIEQRRGAVS